MKLYQNIIWKFRFKKLINEIINIGDVDYFFVANLFSDDKYIKMLTNQIPYRSLVMIDDGTSTVTIVNKLSKLINNTENSKTLSIDEVVLPASICFFSSYPIKIPRQCDTLVNNNYSILKRKIVNPSHSNEYIFFLGSPLYDVDYLSFAEYLFILHKIKRYFGDTGLNIYYIPHRTENQSILKIISSTFEILEFDKPIEHVLVEQPESRPIILASFFSSGLSNSAIIFSENENINFYSFYLGLLKKNQDLVDDVYSSFKDLDLPNFKIIRDY